MCSAVFQKHELSTTWKRTVKTVEHFDPRPLHNRGTASNNFPALLEKVLLEELRVSLLLHRQWSLG